MVIKTAPKTMTNAALEKAFATISAHPEIKKINDRFDAKRAKESQKRKPSGKAKVAVTLRLSQECVSYFQKEYGVNWRVDMQNGVEARSFGTTT